MGRRTGLLRKKKKNHHSLRLKACLKPEAGQENRVHSTILQSDKQVLSYRKHLSLGERQEVGDHL